MPETKKYPVNTGVWIATALLAEGSVSNVRCSQWCCADHEVSGQQGMVDVLNALPDVVKRVIMIVALLAAVLGPVLIIIGKTLSAIGTIVTWAPKLAGAIRTVSFTLKEM